MRSKLFVILSITLLMCSSAFAQKKIAVSGPEAVVRDLYAAHKGKRDPFFQNKSRALVDKYFTGSLADAIWKEARDSKPGEVGNLDFDPLYYAQDVHIKNFTMTTMDTNTVKVRFLNMGHPEEITFTVTTPNTASKAYRIDSIVYSDAEDLESILEYDEAGEPKIPLDGEYMIGKVRCSVLTTKNGYWARVQCDDQKDFQVIDVESLTFGTFNPKEKGRKGKFALASDGSINKYIDAAGKEIKVTRAK
jgi:hypothetical protein